MSPPCLRPNVRPLCKNSDLLTFHVLTNTIGSCRSTGTGRPSFYPSKDRHQTTRHKRWCTNVQLFPFVRRPKSLFSVPQTDLLLRSVCRPVVGLPKKEAPLQRVLVSSSRVLSPFSRLASQSDPKNMENTMVDRSTGICATVRRDVNTGKDILYLQSSLQRL